MGGAGEAAGVAGGASGGAGSGGPNGGPNAGPDEDLSLSRSNALIPLLVLFAATVIGIFVVIVRAEPFAPPAGAAADRAFRPADFPRVFGVDGALAGPDLPAGGGPATQFPAPAPPFSEDIFPCSECHADREPDPTRRRLELAHDDIILHHDEEHRWCLDCHDAKDRDHLRLASGALVPFTESYRLCGQCHGTQYRDWRSGIHGRRTGYWDGPKRYLLCVHCHNPHSPRFMDYVPLPPPIRPQFQAPWGGGRAARPPRAGAGAPASASGEEEGHGGERR